MAEHNSDSATNCPLCSKDYTETGDRVPKLLDCGHSLCEKCVSLFKSSDCSVECHECGEKHVMTGGVNFIPKNDRIVHRIKNMRLVKELSRLCKKHGREKGLYCYSRNEILCPLCLEGEDRRYSFHDIYTFREEAAIASRWKKTLQTDWEELYQARKENEEKSKFCIQQIRLEKDRMLMEITKVFDELLKQVSDDKKDNDIELEDMLAETEANIAEIDGVLKETDSTSSATMKRIERIIKTKAMLKERATMTKFLYYEYTKSKARVQRLCGKLKERVLFRKMYFYNTIDESESEVGSIATTPQSNGSEGCSNNIASCESDAASCGDTEQNDDDDDDAILLEETDNEFTNSDSDYSATTHDDVRGSVQVRSSTKRRRTKTAKAIRIDSSHSTAAVSGISPAKKSRTDVEERCHAYDFSNIQKGNSFNNTRLLVSSLAHFSDLVVVLYPDLYFAEKTFEVCDFDVVELMCVLDDTIVFCGQKEFR